MTGLFIALIFFAGGSKDSNKSASTAHNISQQANTSYQSSTVDYIADYPSDKELLRRKLRDMRIQQYRLKAHQSTLSPASKALSANASKTKTYRPRPPARQMVSAQYALKRPIDMSIFNSDMSFEEALNEIQNAGLPLVIMWSDLQNNAYVTPDTAIGFQGNGKATTKFALDLILRSVSQGASPIRYLLDNNTVTVATDELKLTRKYVKVYDIAELTSQPWPTYQRGNNSRQGNSGFSNSGQGAF